LGFQGALSGYFDDISDYGKFVSAFVLSTRYFFSLLHIPFIQGFLFKVLSIGGVVLLESAFSDCNVSNTSFSWGQKTFISQDEKKPVVNKNVDWRSF
jgi:hypothetical protein